MQYIWYLRRLNRYDDCIKEINLVSDILKSPRTTPEDRQQGFEKILLSKAIILSNTGYKKLALQLLLEIVNMNRKTVTKYTCLSL